jgi:hypothetical protein
LLLFIRVKNIVLNGTVDFIRIWGFIHKI